MALLRIAMLHGLAAQAGRLGLHGLAARALAVLVVTGSLSAEEPGNRGNSPWSLEELGSALGSTDPIEAARAAKLLGLHGLAALGALEQGLQAPQPATNYWSAYQIGRLEMAVGPQLPLSDGSLARLRGWSSDPSSPPLRLVANFVLASRGARAALASLLETAEGATAERSLRLSALQFIAMLGPVASELLPAVREIERSNPPDGPGDYHVGGAARAARLAIEGTPASNHPQSRVDGPALETGRHSATGQGTPVSEGDHPPQSVTSVAALPVRPNILWISCEDISPDLGCYGQTAAVTPRLDQFARDGVRFDRAFAVGGVCAVSRSAIITGRYSVAIGSQHMRSQIVPSAGVHCFTEHLRAIGYFCTNRSKTDYQFPVPHTAWDRQGDRHRDWRERPTPETPFFSVINLTCTHESQVRHSAAAHERVLAEIGTAAHAPDQLNPETIPPYLLDDPIVRQDIAWYHDNISLLDQQVGKILDDLKADGLADHTLVFFWGDHGMGLPRGKRWLYDTGLRVPLLARWPGVLTAGSVRPDLVSLLDLVPTTLAVAGVPTEAIQRTGFHGRILFGPQEQTEPEFLFAHRDRMDEAYDLQRACRDRRFKYILNFEPEKSYAQPITYLEQMPTMQQWRAAFAAGQLNAIQAAWFAERKPTEELYDTQSDPWEVHNLAHDERYADRLRAMRRAVWQWQTMIGDQGMIPEPVQMQQQRSAHPTSQTTAPQIQIAADRTSIVCPDPEAAIDYRLRVDGQWTDWRLYNGPIDPAVASQIEAIASHTGYQDSQVVSQELHPQSLE
jgi:uncharacterized sulfatase